MYFVCMYVLYSLETTARGVTNPEGVTPVMVLASLATGKHRTNNNLGVFHAVKSPNHFLQHESNNFPFSPRELAGTNNQERSPTLFNHGCRNRNQAHQSGEGRKQNTYILISCMSVSTCMLFSAADGISDTIDASCVQALRHQSVSIVHSFCVVAQFQFAFFHQELLNLYPSPPESNHGARGPSEIRLHRYWCW